MATTSIALSKAPNSTPVVISGPTCQNPMDFDDSPQSFFSFLGDTGG